MFKRMKAHIFVSVIMLIGTLMTLLFLTFGVVSKVDEVVCIYYTADQNL
jgi:hypothetical protein